MPLTGARSGSGDAGVAVTSTSELLLLLALMPPPRLNSFASVDGVRDRRGES